MAYGVHVNAITLLFLRCAVRYVYKTRHAVVRYVFGLWVVLLRFLRILSPMFISNGSDSNVLFILTTEIIFKCFAVNFNKMILSLCCSRKNRKCFSAINCHRNECCLSTMKNHSGKRAIRCGGSAGNIELDENKNWSSVPQCFRSKKITLGADGGAGLFSNASRALFFLPKLRLSRRGRHVQVITQ